MAEHIGWKPALSAALGKIGETLAVRQVALTSNLIYTIPEGTPSGIVHRVAFTQDDTGGRTVMYGDAPLTIALTAGATTLVAFWPGGRVTYPGATLATGTVEWADVANPPATYEPSTHTHVVADLTDYMPGSGGASSAIIADDTPAAPAEGESASYFVTSAVSWPAGLVWSTDPDGGVAPTITGTALVSMFTVSGVTRAILGATFPALPDAVAPVAGTLASSSITETGFTLTVTGASDVGGLHAQPYSFDTGTGTFGAWQTPATLAVTGKTAGTTHTCRHKVRDAAGNETTGASITVSTVAADATAPTWTATFTMGTPTETSVVATASAMATDNVGVTGYEVSYNGGSTYATITPSGSNFTLTGTAGTTYATTKLRAKDAAGNTSTPVLSVPSYTMAASSDVTAPTVGTMAASAITPSGFTLTVSGAADETALHATPYAFTTDGGTTYSAYQASPVYAATGKTAETGYSCNWRVRDAEGNVSIGTAQTVTTGVQETLQEAILALSPAAYWPMKETSGTVFTDVSGNGADASFTAGVTLNQANGHPTVSSAAISSPDRDAFTVGANGLTVFCLVRPSSIQVADSSLITKGVAAGTYEWALQYSSAQVRAETWTTDGLSISGQAKAKVLATNQWHLLAAAFNEGNTIDPFSLYIDSGTTQTGTTVKSNAGRVGQNTTSALYIARPGISGAIGHVAIFQDRLTDAQMQALYLAARSEGYLP